MGWGILLQTVRIKKIKETIASDAAKAITRSRIVAIPQSVWSATYQAIGWIVWLVQSTPKCLTKLGQTGEEAERNSFEISMHLKLLQLNSGRCVESMNLAWRYAVIHGIDLLVISEPNIKEASKKGWLTDITKAVAIKIVNQNVAVGNFDINTTGFLCIQVNNVAVYSCYISPNCEINEFESYLDELQRSVSGCPLSCIIGGDFNAKSSVWGGKTNDRRGDILLDWIASNNLIIQNQGFEPTFRRNNSTSIIDFTLTSENISGQLTNWRVLEEESLSDHMFIYYELNNGNSLDTRGNASEPQGWKITNINEFVKNFKDGIVTKKESSVEITAEEIVSVCTEACKKSF